MELKPNVRAATGNKPRHRYKRGYSQPSGSNVYNKTCTRGITKHGGGVRGRGQNLAKRPRRPLVGDAVQRQPPASARTEEREKREDRS